MIDHPLASVLAAAVAGRFPPIDGVIEIVPPDPRGEQAIVEFSGHSLVLTDHPDADDILAGRDAFGGASHPEVVLALAGDRFEIGMSDVLFARRAGDHGDEPLDGIAAVVPTDLHDLHPRAVRAHRHRRNVTVFGDDRGLVTVGRGLVGRVEVSVEVVDARPGAGAALVEGALRHLPADTWVFAQVTPGNVRSMRRFFSLGFRPIAGEILLTPH